MNTSLTQIALDGMVVGNIFDTVNDLTSEAMIALKAGGSRTVEAKSVMLAVGVIVGNLTAGVRYQARVARYREQRGAIRSLGFVVEDGPRVLLDGGPRVGPGRQVLGDVDQGEIVVQRRQPAAPGAAHVGGVAGEDQRRRSGRRGRRARNRIRSPDRPPPAPASPPCGR